MTPQGRHALLIGIDEYPHFPEQNQLRTCVADVELMADLLVGRFGFPRDAVRLLRDREATRDGIHGAMEELIERADDDVVVIHYSGHGSWRWNRNGWNPDGVSETLVPYDSGRKCFPRPFENRDVVDHEIHDWLLRLNERTPHVTLIFDSCHAGTITRRSRAGIRRAPPDLEPDAPRSRPARKRKRFQGRFGDHHVLIAACREDESAHEYRQKGHGALTFFLHQELLAARAGETYRDLFERVAPRVTGTFHDQRPQLEGAWDREIFGFRDFEPMRHVAVEGRAGRHVVLGVGEAQGLATGTELSVFPPGTRAAESTPARVRVTAVGAVRARAEILEEAPEAPVQAGSRAVGGGGEAWWKVAILGAPPASSRAALERALEASPVLSLAGSGESCDALIHYLVPGGEAPRLRGAVEVEQWAAVDGDGRLLLRPLPGDRRHVGELIDALDRWCRYDRVLRMRNPHGRRLDGKVDVELLRREDGEWRSVAAGDAVYEEGDRLAVSVANRHDALTHVAVLDLGLTGAIRQIYPVAGAHEALAPGRTLRIGVREGDELEVFLPEGFPFDPRGPAAGVEHVKVFATTRPADFRWLTQGGVVAGPRHPLERRLRQTLLGPRRGARRRHIATDDWTTVERSFHVRRKGF